MTTTELNLPQAILDSEFLAVAVLRERRFLWVSRGLEALFGYAAGELVGQLSRVLYPDDESYEVVGGKAYAALENRASIQFSTSLRRRDGRLASFEMSFSRLQAMPGAFMVVAIDRSEPYRMLGQLQFQDQILANIIDGVVVTTTDGIIRYTNAAFDAMFGYGSGELVGQSVLCLGAGSPDELAVMNREIMNTLAADGQWRGDILNRRKDGTRFWSSANMSAHPSPEFGTVWVSVQRDISERRWIEHALREAQGRFQNIYDHAPIGIAITDASGAFAMCNPGFARMLGCRQVDLIGRPFAAWIHPEHRETDLAGRKRLLAGEIEVFQVESRYQREDGSEIWVDKVVSCLGKPAQGQFIVLASDMTDRKRAEQAMTESRTLLDLALAGSGLGVWDIDLVGGRQLFDERFCAILGYRPGELSRAATGWLQWVHPEDVARARLALQAHMAGETAMLSLEQRLRHKDGHWVWVAMRGRVSYDASGHPVRQTGTIQDISERQRVVTEGSDLLARIATMLASLNPAPGERPAAPAPSSAEPVVNLSRRHREVLVLLADGLTTAQVAAELGISSETVASHRRLLMQKLGLKNKAAMIRYALQHGIAR